jgi:hypothetical protein
MRRRGIGSILSFLALAFLPKIASAQPFGV